MPDDSFKINPDKLIDPEHYPGDKPLSVPTWASGLSFPVTSESLIEQFGDE